jgi:hypothetical protein
LFEVVLELPSLSCPRPKDDDCDATPNAPNAIVAVAAIAYFGVKYFLKEVDSSFVFWFSKAVDSITLFSLEVIILFSDINMM